MKKTFVLSSLFCVLFIPLLATPATKVSLSIAIENACVITVETQEGLMFTIENSNTGKIYGLVPVILDAETGAIKIEIYDIGNTNAPQLTEKLVSLSKASLRTEKTDTKFNIQTVSVANNSNNGIMATSGSGDGNCCLMCAGGFRVCGGRVTCDGKCCTTPGFQDCPPVIQPPGREG